eukprot:Gb_37717 [translate_table: standard]
MASISTAVTEGSLNSLLQLNYGSTQIGKFTGINKAFRCQYPSLCFRHSIGGLGLECHRDLCFSYNSFGGQGIKWKRNVVGRFSSSLQSLLNTSLSVAYDASSELKSKFSKVFQAHVSTKKTLQEAVAPLIPISSKLNRDIPVNFALGVGIAVTFMAIALRRLVARQPGDDEHGSVSDLVKRGQLRSDRRAISRPLKYDDPFNNPLVKMSESNSTVRMCGKVFRLTPVTLTQEEVLSHQNRRIRAYQWKRPTVFLKEGEPIPPGVDADTVRWIPANHPFATASNDIDEDFAQKNIYQKRGVPSRVRAEHEALQRKMTMEATENEHQFNPMVEHLGSGQNQTSTHESLEEESGYPNGDIKNKDSNVFQALEGKIVDPGLRSV